MSESVDRSHGALAVVAGCALMVVIVGVLALGRGDRTAGGGEGPDPLTAEATWPAGTRRAPDFTLSNQDARSVSLTSLRGRTVLLTFLDSRCARVCLQLGPALGRVQRAAAAGARPLIVAVSVNPEDTPASVRAMAEAWRWKPDEWQWLMGSTDELAPVWSVYGVDVRATPEGLLHTGAVYVVDADGYSRAGFASPIDAERVIGVVRSVRDQR